MLGTFVLTVVFLTGCATAPTGLHTPMLLEGTVQAPRWTGWAFDFCGHRQPVRFDDRLGSMDCIPHGGELYAATLAFPKEPGGASIARSLKIAFPAHALAAHYVRKHYLVLQPSPADFAAATGIKYVAAVWGNYEPEHQCLRENGFGHTDWRDCSDESFHESKRGQCVPIPEYLSHYSTRP